MAKRNWSNWGKNILDELSKTSGVVGAISTTIATGAVIVSAAPAVAIASGVVAAGSLVYAAVSGFPEKLVEPTELVGKEVDLKVLDNLSEPISRLGIIGASESGKSTLLKRLISQTPENVRTSQVYATVFVLQSVPQKYVALIDGDGSQYYQQFKVAENASSLIVLLDHNISDTIEDSNDDRIKEHNKFLTQLEGILKSDNKLSKLKYVHFLLNKRDLWESSDDAVDLENWFAEVTTRWENFGYSIEITHTAYSNEFPDDLVSLINLISSNI